MFANTQDAQRHLPRAGTLEITQWCMKDSNPTTVKSAGSRLLRKEICWSIRNTCVSIQNSISSVLNPDEKMVAGSIPIQGHFWEPLNWLLNFWSRSDEFLKQSKTDWISALSEATCIWYIGHLLMIPYTGEGMGKVRVDK